MILLDPTSYEKVIAPLTKVKINNLFARAVVEKHVTGKIYVDDPHNPASFLIAHPYGMSLLFGNSQNEDFNRELADYAFNINKVRNSHEWLQAFPGEWDTVLTKLFGDRLIPSSEAVSEQTPGIIELNTRLNFRFNRKKYLAEQKKMLPCECNIVRTDASLFHEMKGKVIPLNFWDSAEDFLTRGAGFCITSGGNLATTAYSAFVLENQLEIGIETLPAYREKGFALHACSALIDYCIERNYEPIWACRFENTNSYKLATRLGFEISAKIPFYRLSN
ncbi:MAG: GNAT family N-acetyltransferase [Bacteroidales bacterium]|nr:GNAT family N-acetyltransferase [Bacteroidales bacterium]